MVGTPDVESGWKWWVLERFSSMKQQKSSCFRFRVVCVCKAMGFPQLCSYNPAGEYSALQKQQLGFILVNILIRVHTSNNSIMKALMKQQLPSTVVLQVIGTDQPSNAMLMLLRKPWFLGYHHWHHGYTNGAWWFASKDWLVEVLTPASTTSMAVLELTGQKLTITNQTAISYVICTVRTSRTGSSRLKIWRRFIVHIPNFAWRFNAPRNGPVFFLGEIGFNSKANISNPINQRHRKLLVSTPSWIPHVNFRCFCQPDIINIIPWSGLVEWRNALR